MSIQKVRIDQARGDGWVSISTGVGYIKARDDEAECDRRQRQPECRELPRGRFTALGSNRDGRRGF